MGKFPFLCEVSFHLHSAIANAAKIQTMDALNDTLEKVSRGGGASRDAPSPYSPSLPCDRAAWVNELMTTGVISNSEV